MAREPGPRPGGQHPGPGTAAPAARLDRQTDPSRSRAPRRSAGLLTVAAALLALAALAGCSTSPSTRSPASPAPASPAVGSPETAAPPSVAAPRLADPAETCASFAAAAASVDPPTGTLGQSRQAAARTYSSPRLQELYDGAGQGRDDQHDLWKQHHALVLVHAQPVGADLHHDHDHPGEKDHGDDQPPAAQGAERTAVIVTGTAHGGDGWTAPVQPYRLEYLLLDDPVLGWLVDDLVTDPLPTPAPATSR